VFFLRLLDFKRDFCVVGLLNLKRISCGRLVPAGEGHAELGGIFVDEKYRYEKIVEYK
jgi:hypothetical protein